MKEQKIAIIDLKKLVMLLWDKKLAIIASTLICTTLMFLYAALFVPPTYSASVDLIVNNAQTISDGTVTNSDLTASTNLANTYTVILKSYTVLQRTIDELGLNYDYDSFAQRVSAKAIDGTTIIRITVKESDPLIALRIAKKIGEIAPDIIKEKASVGSVMIVDEARVASKPYSPNKKNYASLGALAGFVISSFIFITATLLNDKFVSEESVHNTLEIPVIGTIPLDYVKGRKSDKNRISNRKLHLVTASRSNVYREAFKSLRANLNYAAASEKSKVILVTSSLPAEGKSNVSINLAITLAESGKSVVLLDCDLRKGKVQQYMHVPRRLGGITTILNGETELADSIFHDTEHGIDIITAGPIVDNPSELLSSQLCSNLIKALANHYDFVICDSAPISAVADTTILCKYADGALFIVSYDRVKKQSALYAKEQLERCNLPILGVVFNMYDYKRSKSYNRGYGYYSYGVEDYYTTPHSGKKSRSESGRKVKSGNTDRSEKAERLEDQE